MKMTLKSGAMFVMALSLSAVSAFGQTQTQRYNQPGAVTANRPVVGGEKMGILETAKEAGTFNTLTAAIKAAGLEETLKGKGPFTVFAPTDEAFAKLPAGTVEKLLEPGNKEKLAGILKYHVVSGDVKADKVKEMDSAETVNGKKVTIKTEGETVMIDNAKVVKADIACKNGTIHVIDSVLMPKE